MKIFTLDNLNFKCKIMGKGPLVVLLHGFGGHPSDWDQVANKLSSSNMVVIPNLKPMFAVESPLTYSQQVRIVSKLVQLINPSQQSFHLVGASYGGTLSWGLRMEMGDQIASHVLINPMPFSPLSNIRNRYVWWAKLLSHIPLGMKVFFNLGFGRSHLKILAKTFHMGIVGKHEIKRFDGRRFGLIKKAIDRLNWIEKNEDWCLWNKKANDYVPSLIFYSEKDGLFAKEAFKSYAHLINNCDIKSLPHNKHMLHKWKPSSIVNGIHQVIHHSQEMDRVKFRAFKIKEGRDSLNRSHLKVG